MKQSHELKKFCSVFLRTITIITLAAFSAVFFVGCGSSQPGNSASSTSNILVNGRIITPAGTTSGPVGIMPLNIVISPDGQYAITTSSCLKAVLSTLRVSDGTVVSSLAFSADDPGVPNGGLFYGLAFDPTPHNNTYTLYAAQGAYGTVAVLTLAADGTLTQQANTIPTTSSRPNPYMPLDQPAGIAFANGNIFMANYFSINLLANYEPASTLSIYRASDGARLGKYTFMDAAGTNTPSFPYAVVAKSDGTRAYVASQRDGCVYVLDTSDPGNIQLVPTYLNLNPNPIPNLTHPSALLLNKAQTLLYVANAGSDTISVVNVANDQLQVMATVLLRPSNVSYLPGVSPSGLALSFDEKTLYASLGDFNAVGVIDTVTNQLSGYIPVGWYPTAIAATPDGKALLVTNGWGTTAMNPNPQLDYLNPDVLGINFLTLPQISTWVGPPGPGYVLNSIPGNVSRIDLTKALPTLAQSTAQVIRNNQNTPAMGRSADRLLAGIGIKSGRIKHVIYVIKENRGYDQVLGDLPRGNGDPSLTIYGREITPNQHALAERFILLDNFYNNAPVSGEGWVWCTQSVANAFTIKSIPYIYQLSLATYEINYAFEGQVNGYITGGYPATDQDGNCLSSSCQPASSIPDVAEAPGGYIWDGVKAAGLTYRNYGFFLSSGAPTNPPFVIPDNYPNKPNLSPPGHIPTPLGQVAGLSDYDYRKFDFNYPDSDAWVKYGFQAADLGLTTGTLPCPNGNPSTGCYASLNSPIAVQGQAQPSRFSEWNREFQEMLKQDPTGNSVPAFMMVRFMRDHTMGLNPTYGSPRAMMADNDYAVGELVQAVSNSPIWESTVIFVIEDDAQFSDDHVDTHRSFCQVISPWIKRGTVDSRFYDTNSVLKSIELLLGLSPMSQYDHFSNPIMGGWDFAPNNSAAYTAILPSQDIIGEVNPNLSSYNSRDPRLRLAVLSSKMNWKVADAAPYRILNEVLWKDARGPNAKMPKLRVSALTMFDKNKARNFQHDDDD
ncbi:MAG: bifunctional YncE family protein/alkaline phosphatase family protein [Smithella sp.]